MTYVVHYNDEDDNLIDVEYFDTKLCMDKKVETLDGATIEYGAWPCPDWPDYNVYCASCGTLMHKEMESD